MPYWVLVEGDYPSLRVMVLTITFKEFRRKLASLDLRVRGLYCFSQYWEAMVHAEREAQLVNEANSRWRFLHEGTHTLLACIHNTPSSLCLVPPTSSGPLASCTYYSTQKSCREYP